ncbi:MAG: DUF3108 domain-containing protein [Xanthomonadales bacterium]|nr:DUF3108 domain-containing protein [Xanthomonadales bacterium]
MKPALLLATFGAAALLALADARAAEAPLQPFSAEYATLRNGSEAGRTTLTLTANDDGSWTLVSDTRGTAGLARLAGIQVVETTRLRWNDGRPEALDYSYRQDGLKKRSRRGEFDWAAGQVRMEENGRQATYAIVPGLIDRQTVTLAIAADLSQGARAFDYKVAVKDHVEDMRYSRVGEESVRVPAGAFDAVLMQRERAPGAELKRVSQSWFAPSIGWLPVKIEQAEKKGDTITLELVSFSRPGSESKAKD